VKDNSLYVNLFVQNTGEMNLTGTKVSVKQTTEYPWNGKIDIELSPEKESKFEVLVRIPGWATEHPIPGDLYKYKDVQKNTIRLLVNGKESELKMKNGYASIEQNWKKGDKISLDLPMPVRFVEANANVKPNIGRIAVQRGPIVYCGEWTDNKDKKVMNLYLDKFSGFSAEYKKDMLGGVLLLKGKAKGTYEPKEGQIQSKDVDITLIPYYSWANRGRGEMQVWFPTSADLTRPVKAATFTNQCKVTGSLMKGNLSAINDMVYPTSSNDPEVPYFHWWPQNDTTEWIQYDFPKETEVSSSSVYWYDDGPWGGCRIPASWRILYKDGEKWIPVTNKSAYSVTKDQKINVSFDKVKTKAMRLEVTLPKEFSSGIYEWTVK